MPGDGKAWALQERTRTPMVVTVSHEQETLHARHEGPDVVQAGASGELEVVCRSMLAGCDGCVGRETLRPVPVEALETAGPAVARRWAGRLQEDCVDAWVDVGAARELGGCEGAPVASQSHVTGFSTHLKQNWRWAGGDVGPVDAEVDVDDPGSWEGSFPDLETDLGGQLIETLE